MLDKIMLQMTEKSSQAEGNDYVFIVNTILWGQMQSTLRQYLINSSRSNEAFYSQKTGSKVNLTTVGATFNTWIHAGNTITFKVDKALSIEYPNKGYGVCIDMTSDLADGKPAMAMFTIKGGEFTRNTIAGAGGLNGTTSGEVSTPVAGNKLIYMGYAGLGVFSPFKSVIIEEQK